MLKLILLPLGILAFLIFLLILGAIGLGVSLMVIAVVSWTFRVLSGRHRPRLRRPRWPRRGES
jgi:hypothetical protein